MVDPPVDDVYRVHSAVRRIQRRGDLRQHARRRMVPSANNSSMREAVRPVISRPSRSSTPGVLVNSTSFSRPQDLRHLAGHQVGIDVVRQAVGAESDRRDDRNERAVLQRPHQRWIDRIDLADLSQIVGPVRIVAIGKVHPRARIRPPSLPVSPTACPPTRLINITSSCCTWPASTHSTISIVSASVTRMPWMNCDFFPTRSKRVVDLRAAAVHDDRPHPDQLQKHDVVREAFLQRLLRHRIAAVLDDDGAAVETGGCTVAPRTGFRLSARSESAPGPWSWQVDAIGLTRSEA